MTDNTDLPPPGPGLEALPELEARGILQQLLHYGPVSAILLLTAAVSAIVVANSPAADWYHDFFAQYLGIFLGGHEFKQSLHHWINDGLMAIFFFLVGLEIKRELLVGELASPRKAMLPIAAAVGDEAAVILVVDVIAGHAVLAVIDPFAEAAGFEIAAVRQQFVADVVVLADPQADIGVLAHGDLLVPVGGECRHAGNEDEGRGKGGHGEVVAKTTLSHSCISV